jgi:CPA2 family monovalent cation:H+ antiporter-2
MILTETVIIFGLTVVVLFVCSRLRIPSIVGFLLSGMLAGPYGLKLIPLGQDVNVLADIGVVLLLFTIGLEFSLENILKIRRYVSVGGTLQVMLSIFFVAVIMQLLGFGPSKAVFAGFLISLSSTAIVLKLLQQSDEINAPHGQVSMAILIFQDLVVVPMMLIIPILSGQSTNITASLLILLAKAAGIVLLTIVSARWIVPFILFQVARLRSNEIFILCIIVLCFAVAWLTSSIGLSLSLGAFLAGLIISESEYSHQAFSTIMPFRDVFTSFFFISIGMLFNYHFLIEHPVIVVVTLLSLLIIKTLANSIATFFIGFPIRTVILTGFALAQVGEFSFVLSRTGLEAGLLSQNTYQLFLSVSILTMAGSPFMMRLSHRVAGRMETWNHPRWLLNGIGKGVALSTSKIENEPLHDHLIIIGYGVVGVNVSKAATIAKIPHLVLEMNPETVKRERRKGKEIYYGDATQESILHHLNVHTAKVAVIAIPDPLATRAIVSLVRRLNPLITIIVRTRYVREMKPLYGLGANEVIPEEFEASVEMFTLMLSKYLLPRNMVEDIIDSIRRNSYEALRTQSTPTLTVADLQKNITGLDIHTFSVPDSSPFNGKSLEENDFRQEHDISILAIIRHETVIKNPGGDIIIQPRDRIIVFGATEAVRSFGERMG